ncbi:MAG: DUF2339 domain-containing protein [Desulfobulbaceae bacterium]|nr:DUF2339 domain-containing protein [Desulfobulbaceae bacterium]
MTIFSIILGAVVGAILLRFPAGLIFGGLMGYLLFRVNDLEIKLKQLGDKLPTPETKKSTSVPLPPHIHLSDELKQPEISDPIETITKQSDEEEYPTFTLTDEPESQITPKAQVRHQPQPLNHPTEAASHTDHNDLRNIIKRYFTGGNTVVRVGVVVLFFGVSFLLKYTVEQNLIPIELRLAAIGLGAIAMLGIGWRLRLTRFNYALILQGGAVGILYMDIFGAMKLYHLIPLSFALLLLVCLSFFSAVLAIAQNARALAVIGITGGFLAPILTSSGSGNHVMLFSYYALLNSGILFTAKYKPWRELNLLGFFFTFIIATLWGVLNYTPDHYASTQPFLIIFFIFYVIIGLLFTKNQPLRNKGYVDCTLIFGTPLVCFGLQAALVKPYEYGLAWSALSMGLLYAWLARLILDRGSAAMRTVVESFLALGVVFGTVAIPLALDGYWTAGSWALEGAAIVWIALRQQRILARIFGLSLQFCAGIAFLVMKHTSDPTIPILNGLFLAALLVAISGFLSGYFLYRHRHELASSVPESLMCFFWGLLWWCGAGLHEVHFFAGYRYELSWNLGFGFLTALVGYYLGNKYKWPYPQHIYKGFCALLIPAALYSFAEVSGPPSRYGGWAAWLPTLGGCYLLIYLNENKCKVIVRDLIHITLALVFIFLITDELSWWTDHFIHGKGVWDTVCWGLVPNLFLILITKYHNRLHWPLKAHQTTYLYRTALCLAFYLIIGSVVTNLSNRGNPWPLPYYPFINPLDLIQIAVLLSLGGWLVSLSEELNIQPLSLSPKNQIITLSALTFLWLNGVLVRTLHHWAGIPFHVHSFIRSDLAQTYFSIFWTLSAFVIMLGANKKGIRTLWSTGAFLIGVVVLKLFLFDLVNIGTLERIISFMGVGVICLVIGYLAPLPPKNDLS